MFEHLDMLPRLVRDGEPLYSIEHTLKLGYGSRSLTAPLSNSFKALSLTRTFMSIRRLAKLDEKLVPSSTTAMLLGTVAESHLSAEYPPVGAARSMRMQRSKVVCKG
jgi:hypothetical protein